MYFKNLVTSGPCKQKPNFELDNLTGSYKIPFSASLLTKRSHMHRQKSRNLLSRVSRKDSCRGRFDLHMLLIPDFLLNPFMLGM